MDEKTLKFLAALKAFVDAGYDLANAWDELEDNAVTKATYSYPVELSFDDLVYGFQKYLDTQKQIQ